MEYPLGKDAQKKETNMTLSVQSWMRMLKPLLGQSTQHQVQVLWIQWRSYRDH